jgi:transcriptional regulator with XRE-family HTH domain
MRKIRYDLVMSNRRGRTPSPRLTRLSELRSQKRMTRVRLAELAGVDYSTLWRIENGRHGACNATAAKIAQALEVEPEELVAAP